MTYGLLIIWGSCSKTVFDNIEQIRARATKIIYRLDWCAPKEEVLNTVSWLPLRHTYCQRLLFLAHNCFYGAAPRPVHELREWELGKVVLEE